MKSMKSRDSSRKWIHLTVIVAMVAGATYVRGEAGNCLFFDGYNDAVRVAHAPALAMTNNYTLEAWVRPAAFGWLRGIVGKYQTPAADGWLLRLCSTAPHTGLGFDGKETTTGLLQAGLWYHVAAVNSNQVRRLYLNGQEVPLSGPDTLVKSNTDDVMIGVDYFASPRYWSGWIDEVRIWNMARSEDEIRDTMHVSLGGGIPGLVACYVFNTNAGQLVPDVTGNGHNGVFVDQPLWDKSQIPSAAALLHRTQCRGVWSSRTNSLPSGRLSVTATSVVGTNTVVFGHDNSPETWVASDVPPGVSKRLARVWQFECFGTVTGLVQVATAGLDEIGDGGRLRLLLDVDGDGNFTNAVVLSGSYAAGVLTVAVGEFAHLGQYTLGLAEFTGMDLGSVQLAECWATWADYDNDGDFDAVIAGCTYTNYPYPTNLPVTLIYRNDGGAFTLVNAGLPGVRRGCLAWGHYDSDGLLDIIVAGRDATGTLITRIYRNTGTGFADTGVALPGVEYCSVAWGDFNNDGLQDVLLAGCDAAGAPVTRLYRNTGGGLVQVNAGLPDVGYCSVAWCDYDNDGDLDILLAGRNAAGQPITRIYRNTGGVFEDVNAGLPGAEYCSVAWGDYDNDGDPDIALAGANLTISDVVITRVYRNDAGTFTNINTDLPGVFWCSVAWGDMDNDGDLDLVITGAGTNTVLTRVYVNNAGVFTDSGWDLDGIRNGNAAWGDADNNGTLDILVAGSDAGGAFKLPRVYWNYCAGTNTPPTVPTNLVAWVAGSGSAVFRWSPPSDSQTPARGLTYNLRIGTVPMGQQVMPPPSNVTNGYMRLPQPGNVGHNTNWVVHGLIANTPYYWSVQAVDSAYGAGPWSAEQVFVWPVLPTVTTAPVTDIGCTSARCGGTVTGSGSAPVTARGVCWSMSPNPTVAGPHTVDGAGQGMFVSTLTNLLPGQVYYVRAYASNLHGVAYGEQRQFTTLMVPPGNALQFNGVNAYVTVGDADDLDLTNNYTLECWFRADKWTTGALISKNLNADDGGYMLGLMPGNSLVFDGMYPASLNLQTSVWYHVAAVNSNGTRRLFVNGVERELFDTPWPVRANTAPVLLGRWAGAGTPYFAGQLDEVRIWNAPRSQQEIRQTMHRVLTGTEQGLVAYYKFDHNSGTVLADVTGRGHDGTLVSGPAWITSSFPCAYLIEDGAEIVGAWVATTNSFASSLLQLCGAVVGGTDFALCAHDGQPLVKNSSDIPGAFLWRLQRAWRMETRGAVTGAFAFDCSILAGWINNTDRLYLLADADGTFANAEAVKGNYTNGVLLVPAQELRHGWYYTLAEHVPNWIVIAGADPNGTIAPCGAVPVPPGGTVTFTIVPNAYYHVLNVLSNGSSLGPVTSVTWSNVSGYGWIYATFAPDLAALGTPHWWLAQYGLTNGDLSFDAAELANQDGDAYLNWEEYVADTDPTDPTSYLRIIAVTNRPPMELYFISSPARMYTLYTRADLAEGTWTKVPGSGPRPGTGGLDLMQVTSTPASNMWFRLGVSLP